MASAIDSKILGAAGTAAVGLLKEIRSDKKTDSTGPQDTTFKDTLAQKTDEQKLKIETVNLKTDDLKTAAATNEKPLLKFSNHALERMNTRGISFSPEQITKIEQGMQRASGKGAKETLVITDDSALIVSLKNSTVVTVMDKSMLKENVFTNIDSTVIV